MADGDSDDDLKLGRLRSALPQNPKGIAARLALAAGLFKREEWVAAARMLVEIEALVPDLTARAAGPSGIAASTWGEAVTMLARIDEQEGNRIGARRRWEFMLANDIDHHEARAHLARLGTGQGPTSQRTTGTQTEATLVSPEGVNTARYEIVRELGRGTTSTVYLARDLTLDIEIALKVLHPAMHATARFRARERFFWEARAAARLRHRGVVAVYDLDENARSLAMEYMPAGTLRNRLNTAGDDAQPGRLPPDEIRIIAENLLETLVHVHQAGLIHGDLKPRNILLRRQGEPVVGDFGVSRLVQDNEATGENWPELGRELGQEHARELPAGTPLYLAPEQLRGAASSISTDLFAVGAVIWELAAGHPMRTRADLTRGHYNPLPLPAVARAHLGAHAAAVGRLIEALTERAPEHRARSAEQALSLL